MRYVLILLLVVFVGGAGNCYADSKFDDILRKAKQGDAKAQYQVGRRYHYLFPPVKKDERLAIEWYLKAAKQNHAHAAYELALIAYIEDNQFSSDEVALKWARKAEDLGSSEALSLLGDMYAKGRCVKQSNSRAIKYYRKAYEAGDLFAKENLVGQLLESWQASDKKEAVKLLRELAATGAVPNVAQRNLAIIYAAGEIILQDDIEAYAWAIIASSNGDKDILEMFEGETYRAIKLQAQARAKVINAEIEAKKKK